MSRMKHLHGGLLHMREAVCHEEELEVWVSGENEDS